MHAALSLSASLTQALDDETNFSRVGRFLVPVGTPREDAGGGQAVRKRHRMVLREIQSFYDDDDHVRDLLVSWQKVPAKIDSNTRISLRLLDWYVTNYSKSHTICYALPSPNGGRKKMFQVHLAYTSYCDCYRRRLFDAFQRSTRIFFRDPDTNAWVSTTIAQANFMRWAHENLVLQHLSADRERVVAHMTQTLQKNRERKKKSKKRKRQELSHAPPTSSCVVMCVDTTSSFVAQTEI